MICDEDQLIIKEFRKVVNMSAKILEAWLKTGESKEVSLEEKETDEPLGYQPGRRIIALLTKQADECTADDIKYAKRVISYINRRLTQKPVGDMTETNWRYSLMNRGHDPENK